MAGQSGDTGDRAADKAADQAGDQRALQAYGDPVQRRFWDAGQNGGRGGGQRGLAQFRVFGFPRYRQRRTAERQVGADFWRHHHAFFTGFGNSLNDGWGKDAVHPGHHQQRPERTHNGDRQPAQIAVNGVHQRGDGATDPDPNRAYQQNRQRRGDQHDQHGFQEVFGDGGRNSVNPAFNVGEAPGHHQRRDHRVGVFHGGHRNVGKLDVLALCGFRHQLNKARVHQHPGDSNRQRHVGFEFNRRRGGNHQRQEEEGAVTDHRQNGERRCAFWQHAGHFEDHRQQLNHRSADNRRDQRWHGADQRIEDPGTNATQGQLRFPDRGRWLHVVRQQVDHFAVSLRDGVANNHLALAVGAYHAHHAADAFKRRAINQRVIFQHEA